VRNAPLPLLRDGQPHPLSRRGGRLHRISSRNEGPRRENGEGAQSSHAPKGRGLRRSLFRGHFADADAGGARAQLRPHERGETPSHSPRSRSILVVGDPRSNRHARVVDALRRLAPCAPTPESRRRSDGKYNPVAPVSPSPARPRWRGDAPLAHARRLVPHETPTVHAHPFTPHQPMIPSRQSTTPSVARAARHPPHEKQNITAPPPPSP